MSFQVGFPSSMQRCHQTRPLAAKIEYLQAINVCSSPNRRAAKTIKRSKSPLRNAVKIQ